LDSPEQETSLVSGRTCHRRCRELRADPDH
jgi:hypothetical protein